MTVHVPRPKPERRWTERMVGFGEGEYANGLPGSLVARGWSGSIPREWGSDKSSFVHGRTTTYADGLARRAFSVAELLQMVEVGILDRDERFELLGGEIVPMAAKGPLHEELKARLTAHIVRGLRDDYRSITETTLHLSDDTIIEPDLLVWREGVPLTELGPDTILVAIEIADSSLSYDLGRKIEIYAQHGIREVWVIDARRLVTRIHRDLTGHRYDTVENHAADTVLTTSRVEGFVLTVSELDV